MSNKSNERGGKQYRGGNKDQNNKAKSSRGGKNQGDGHDKPQSKKQIEQDQQELLRVSKKLLIPLDLTISH